MLTPAMASDRERETSNDAQQGDDPAQELISTSPGAHAEGSEAGNGATSPSSSSKTAPHHSSDRPAAATKTKRVVEYDDEDDEDEDEDAEEERRRRERRARAKQKAARARGPKRKRNIPTTEEQLNIPKRQTIGMLGSVSLLMVIMWFAGRLACNAHPDHLRDPRYVSVDQLARDPKNAGLEFQLRMRGKDYLLANELATGQVADSLRGLLQICESNLDDCSKERDALKNKVTGSASLLAMTGQRATVQVTTYVSNEDPRTTRMELEPVNLVWKVRESREVSDAAATVQAVNASEELDAGVAP